MSLHPRKKHQTKPGPGRRRFGLESLERRDLLAVTAITVPSLTPPVRPVVAGVPFSGQIASFLNNDGAGAGDVAKYRATIDWGDGSPTSTGTIQYDPNILGFDVLASHTYRTPQTATVTATVNDFWDGTFAAQPGTLNVADQAITPTATQPTVVGAVQGSLIPSQDVGTFTDANPMALASDFTATIRWGDGVATAADAINKGADGVYHVLGSHTYGHPSPVGGYGVAISVNDVATTLSFSNQVAVAAAPLVLSTTPVNLTVASANAGGQAIVPAGTVVATFTQAGQPDAASNYMTAASFVRFAGSSTGTALSVTPPGNSGNTFTVATAADTIIAPYLTPGSMPFTLQVADTASGALSVAGGAVTVADVAPTVSAKQPPILATMGAPFSAPVASFALGFGASLDMSAQYAATIDWGDGSTATPGVVRAGASAGTYVVAGVHDYATIGAPIAGQAVGTFPVAVNINRVGMGGASLPIAATATVADAPISAVAATVNLAASSADAQGRAIVPGGTVVGTFTQGGRARFTTAYASSTVGFAGAGAPTPLAISYDPAGGVYTARTAADAVIAPVLAVGSTPFTLLIGDPVGGTRTATGALVVADSPPVGTPTQPVVVDTQGRAFSGPVASFTLPYGAGLDLSGQLTALINWGDGSAPTVGSIGATMPGGTYAVSGSHLFPGVGASIPGQAAGTYPINVQVTRTGAAGARMDLNTAATVADAPITVTGQLDPASDSGASAADAVTNVRQPRFTGTTGPGASVTLFAVPAGTSTFMPIGHATANALGGWSITTVPLPDGISTINVAAVDALGLASTTSQVFPSATAGPLVIAGRGPTVAGVAFLRGNSQVAITFNAPEVPLDLGSLMNPAAYRFTAAGVSQKALVAGSPVLQSYDPTGHTATILVSLNGGHRFPTNAVGVTIRAGTIRDVAGNTLDGTFLGSFPSGNPYQPGGDFHATIPDSAPAVVVANPTAHPKGRAPAKKPARNRKH